VSKAPTTTLVTGPVRSGKSRHAESLLWNAPEVVYVATGRSSDGSDPEWDRRVEVHRATRPSGWRTIETADAAGAVRDAGAPVLLDCLGTWLTAVVDEAGWADLTAAAALVSSRVTELIESLCAATHPVVVVTNEVGWSVVPATASGRFFQDELGRLNAAVSAVAGHVHLVVAGRVLDLTDAPRVQTTPPSGTLRA
jgi:adenosylcobinamide kinase/adenosylcobinamide-phosphate guanylyltransferase